MKIDLVKLEEQFATISSCGRAIDDLYDDLVNLGMSAKRPGIPYVIEVLAEKFREANRTLEAELKPIMQYRDDNAASIEIEVTSVGK